MTDQAARKSADQSKERIVDVARAEVERTGILGLRMAEVAKAAGVSESLLYAYFDDRNGLLAETLGAIWHDYSLEDIEAIRMATSFIGDQDLTPELLARRQNPSARADPRPPPMAANPDPRRQPGDPGSAGTSGRGTTPGAGSLRTAQ